MRTTGAWARGGPIEVAADRGFPGGTARHCLSLVRWPPPPTCPTCSAAPAAATALFPFHVAGADLHAAWSPAVESKLAEADSAPLLTGALDAWVVADNLTVPLPSLPQGSAIYCRALGITTSGTLRSSNSVAAIWP
jgi:hypothetical protein